MQRRLTQAEVDELFRLREQEGWGYQRIARHLNVRPGSVIGRIKRGRAWPSVPRLPRRLQSSAGRTR